MKPLLLFTFFFCLGFANGMAQKKKSFKINPGERVTEKIPKDEIYSYPEFVSGKVYLINNTYSVAMMNYNSLFGEMQFINGKGDTLSLADEKMIKLIVIDKDTFYYDKGYLKLVLNEGDVKLANKKIITFANRQKLGGFGETSQGSIETYGVLSSQSYLKALVANEIITMVKESVFYIKNDLNNFRVINKKTLTDIYPNNEKDLKIYLKENKVDFSNEEDLRKMILYFKKIVPVRPL
jgi:hypothetical protein